MYIVMHVTLWLADPVDSIIFYVDVDVCRCLQMYVYPFIRNSVSAASFHFKLSKPQLVYIITYK